MSLGLCQGRNRYLPRFVTGTCSFLGILYFSRRVSKMLDISSCLDLYFSWDTVCVDSNLNVRYTYLVIAHILMSGNIYSYAAPNGMSLLYETRVFSEVMMAVVSSIVFIVSKRYRWWWNDSCRVLLWSHGRCVDFSILVLVVPFSTPSRSMGGSGEMGVHSSTTLLCSTYA